MLEGNLKHSSLRTAIAKTILVLSLFLSLSGTAFAQIVVEPEIPFQDDSITIKTTVILYDGCWSVDSSNFGIMDNMIICNVFMYDNWDTTVACPQVTIPQTIDHEIGQLSAGSYMVRMQVFHQSLR